MREMPFTTVHRTSGGTDLGNLFRPYDEKRHSARGRFLGQLVRPLPPDGPGFRGGCGAARALCPLGQTRHRSRIGDCRPVPNPLHPYVSLVLERSGDRAPIRGNAHQCNRQLGKTVSRELRYRQVCRLNCSLRAFERTVEGCLAIEMTTMISDSPGELGLFEEGPPPF